MLYSSNVSNKIYKIKKEKESKILISYVICKRNTIYNTCELIPYINAPFTSVTGAIRSKYFSNKYKESYIFSYIFLSLYIE